MYGFHNLHLIILLNILTSWRFYKIKAWLLCSLFSWLTLLLFNLVSLRNNFAIKFCIDVLFKSYCNSSSCWVIKKLHFPYYQNIKIETIFVTFIISLPITVLNKEPFYCNEILNEKVFFQSLYFASFNAVRDQNLKCNLIRSSKTFPAYMYKAVHDIYLVYNVRNGKLVKPKKNGQIQKVSYMLITHFTQLFVDVCNISRLLVFIFNTQ